MHRSKTYDDLARRGRELQRRLPWQATEVFLFGARGNGDAFVALGVEAMEKFSPLIEARMSSKNFSRSHPFGEGPQSLDLMVNIEWKPAVEDWVATNFYPPAEPWKSPVRWFESEQRVRERDHELSKQWLNALENEKEDFTNRLLRAVRERIVWSMFTFLGVPDRLAENFRDWMLDRSSETFANLADELVVWANQPEFPSGPAAAPDGVSHEEYENYCRLVLHSWGHLDAEVTRFVKDGGIDVESEDLVVQCKHINGNVRAPEVQAIFGIAAQKSKQAVVFSAGGFTKDAITFANRAKVALFKLREQDGKAMALNQAARKLARAETSFKELPNKRTESQKGGGLVGRLQGRLGDGSRTID